MKCLLVSKLRSYEEKSSFQDAHGRRDRYGIKIFQLDLGDHILIDFQSNLEYVSLLRLRQEKEHALGFVGCGANEDHSTFWVVKVILRPIK